MNDLQRLKCRFLKIEPTLSELEKHTKRDRGNLSRWRKAIVSTVSTGVTISMRTIEMLNEALDGIEKER